MKRFMNSLDRQTWMLLAITLMLAIALFKPALPVQRNIYNYVFVIDITQSMNARDYHVNGLPSDRLSFVKQSLKYVLQNLPCHSRVSIGLFTTKNIFLLFEPLEICDHYAVIEDSLMKIDWRMAWAANSHIARGIYTSIRDIGKIDSSPRLVFFTDGQQTPSVGKEPPFLLQPGHVKGLIVGVGNLQPVPVPKQDKYNIPNGYWQIQDADSLSGTAASKSGKYLSSVKETHLQRLAGITGLHYHHLETPEKLTPALLEERFGQQESVDTDISWLFAVAALILYLLSFFRVPRFGYR